ncbi:MAG TPA: biopolymer transporter ExbD [Longimicrobiales bacterium]|nr:biopolymer transporter ExbD [Longimicrobiales bacterium]
MALMRKKNKPSGDIPTSSMADIAFLLLIFFLVTTVFDEEKGLEIVLPEQDSEVEVSQKNVIHLMVQVDGLVAVKRGESPQVQRVRSQEIGSIWRQAAAANPNLIAAVKTAPAAPYRYMIDVLDQLQGAGADKISLQVLEE